MTGQLPKTCATCAHKQFTTCMLSGYSVTTERKYPSVCKSDFSGWVPRMPLLKRIATWLYLDMTIAKAKGEV
jgi:hypothetical protein